MAGIQDSPKIEWDGTRFRLSVRVSCGRGPQKCPRRRGLVSEAGFRCVWAPLANSIKAPVQTAARGLDLPWDQALACGKEGETLPKSSLLQTQIKFIRGYLKPQSFGVVCYAATTSHYVKLISFEVGKERKCGFGERPFVYRPVAALKQSVMLLMLLFKSVIP